MVTLNRGDSSGFGFSLLGTAGLPHVIYDIIENSPAAKSGKVSTTYRGFDRIRSYVCTYLFLWHCFYWLGVPLQSERDGERKMREKEKVRGRSKVELRERATPVATRIYTHLHAVCSIYVTMRSRVRRESCEREQPRNNARCISTRVIIASTLCRPCLFLDL